MQEYLHILSINNFDNVEERISNIDLALKDRNHKIYILGNKILVWIFEIVPDENIQVIEENSNYLNYIYNMKKLVKEQKIK